MTDSERYSKLAEGYKFSLKVMKYVRPKLYSFLIETINSSKENKNLFAEMVRDLKIDFVRGTDVEFGEAKDCIVKKGVKTIQVSISYSPSNDYILMIRVKEFGVLTSKTKIYEIHPITLADIDVNDGYIGRVLIECNFKDNEPDKLEQFVAVKSNENIDVYKQDIDHEEIIIKEKSINLNEFVNSTDKEIDLF